MRGREPMRKMGLLARGLGMVCLIVLGCKTAEPDLRPPKQPEKLVVPPDTEARYSQPLEYPKGTPKAAQIKRSGNNSPLADPTRFQSGARTGAGPQY